MGSKIPSVSVVMAAYNGSKFIFEQICSILPQLGDADELIVVDDCSLDNTYQILTGFSDSRLRIFKNQCNLGARQTFEIGIGLSTKSIIFLSDQDDIWHSKKVAQYIDIFNSFPEVTLVLSDARIIDKHGNILLNSFYSRRGTFTANIFSNIYKNKYLGCTMAFKKNILQYALPFPNLMPQHDIWIGCINSIYGKSYFINEKLIDYRHHDTNASTASSNNRASILQMLSWRLSLTTALIFRVFQVSFKKF